MTVIQLSVQASLILVQQKMLQSSIGHPHNTLLQMSAGAGPSWMRSPLTLPRYSPGKFLATPCSSAPAKAQGTNEERAGETWVPSVPASSRSLPERLSQEGRDICLSTCFHPASPGMKVFIDVPQERKLVLRKISSLAQGSPAEEHKDVLSFQRSEGPGPSRAKAWVFPFLRSSISVISSSIK